jgi:type 1 fimbriae regulatory protein FimB/type 1 fimbriae regulatory protein FimE
MRQSGLCSIAGSNLARSWIGCVTRKKFKAPGGGRARMSQPFPNPRHQVCTAASVAVRSGLFSTGFRLRCRAPHRCRQLFVKWALRHACGYALANKGHDTRAIQAWLGHRSITSTAVYTVLAIDPLDLEASTTAAAPARPQGTARPSGRSPAGRDRDERTHRRPRRAPIPAGLPYGACGDCL